MKIYTGGGDRGRTSLFSGERLFKDDARVEAYGDVDELNTFHDTSVRNIETGDDPATQHDATPPQRNC
mgnify:CR=1 FL=1